MLNFSWYFFTYATLNVGTGGHESTLLYPEINDNGKGNLRSTSVGISSLTRRSTFERTDMFPTIIFELNENEIHFPSFIQPPNKNTLPINISEAEENEMYIPSFHLSPNENVCV